MSDQSGSKNSMFGKHHSKEAKDKMRQSKKALFAKLGDNWWTRKPKPAILRDNNPNYRGGQLVPCDNCGQMIWRCPYRLKQQSHHFCNIKCMGEWQSQSSEFLALVINSNRIKPNKQEVVLQQIISDISLPYRYVGDGQFILAGKCPDFMNTNGQKKLIELYGKFWHDPNYFPKADSPEERMKYFAQYGFDTLIVWENELRNPDILKQRLIEFDSKIRSLSK